MAETEAEAATATDAEDPPRPGLIRGFVQNVIGAFGAGDIPARPASRASGFDDPAPSPLVFPPMQSLLRPANAFGDRLDAPSGPSRPASRMPNAGQPIEEYTDAESRFSRPISQMTVDDQSNADFLDAPSQSSRIGVAPSDNSRPPSRRQPRPGQQQFRGNRHGHRQSQQGHQDVLAATVLYQAPRRKSEAQRYAKSWANTGNQS